MKHELAELVTLGRIRNRLLTARTMQTELRLAAERVVGLSRPGSVERFFTLQAVADETGLSAADIVREILKQGTPTP